MTKTTTTMSTISRFSKLWIWRLWSWRRQKLLPPLSLRSGGLCLCLDLWAIYWRWRRTFQIWEWVSSPKWLTSLKVAAIALHLAKDQDIHCVTKGALLFLIFCFDSRHCSPPEAQGSSCGISWKYVHKSNAFHCLRGPYRFVSELSGLPSITMKQLLILRQWLI